MDSRLRTAVEEIRSLWKTPQIFQNTLARCDLSTRRENLRTAQNLYPCGSLFGSFLFRNPSTSHFSTECILNCYRRWMGPNSSKMGLNIFGIAVKFLLVCWANIPYFCNNPGMYTCMCIHAYTHTATHTHTRAYIRMNAYKQTHTSTQWASVKIHR